VLTTLRDRCEGLHAVEPFDEDVIDRIESLLTTENTGPTEVAVTGG
jgi:hypothetical protein